MDRNEEAARHSLRGLRLFFFCTKTLLGVRFFIALRPSPLSFFCFKMAHFCTYCAVLAVVLAAVAYQFLSPHDLGVSFEVVSARPHPSETMKAVVYAEHGPPEVLVFEKEWPRPVPRPHQVLIRVAAAAINPCDFKFRRNPTPWPLSVKPSIPGEDVAGVVVKAPSNSKFKPGDRVAAMMDILGSRWGATAEYAAVPQDYLALVPDSVSLSEAASVPLVALTTVQAFDMVEGGLEGKKVLVQAGAGGVGSFAIQYAKQQARFVGNLARGLFVACMFLCFQFLFVSFFFFLYFLFLEELACQGEGGTHLERVFSCCTSVVVFAVVAVQRVCCFVAGCKADCHNVLSRQSRVCAGAWCRRCRRLPDH